MRASAGAVGVIGEGARRKMDQGALGGSCRGVGDVTLYRESITYKGPTRESEGMI